MSKIGLALRSKWLYVIASDRRERGNLLLIRDCFALSGFAMTSEGILFSLATTI
jgi:hypothetical protein